MIIKYNHKEISKDYIITLNLKISVQIFPSSYINLSTFVSSQNLMKKMYSF